MNKTYETRFYTKAITDKYVNLCFNNGFSRITVRQLHLDGDVWVVTVRYKMQPLHILQEFSKQAKGGTL